jgi:hypothetical protein
VSLTVGVIGLFLRLMPSLNVHMCDVCPLFSLPLASSCMCMYADKNMSNLNSLFFVWFSLLSKLEIGQDGFTWLRGKAKLDFLS